MAAKNIAVFGIYPDRAAVEETVEHLRSAGFRSTDISVLFPDNQGTKDFAHEKNTKAPEGATTGVVAGGITGGVLGWLTGIGALAIPGLGPFVAAGPIVAALAGAGAVGTLGGIVGALVGMGIPEYEAKRYEGRIREGGVLVSVHCDSADWVKRCREIMVQTGGQDIGATGEKTGDFANADKPMPRVRGAGSGSVISDDELYDDRTTDRVTGDRVTTGDRVVTERVVTDRRANPDLDIDGE
jgi:hypothetical protein